MKRRLYLPGSTWRCSRAWRCSPLAAPGCWWAARRGALGAAAGRRLRPPRRQHAAAGLGAARRAGGGTQARARGHPPRSLRCTPPTARASRQSSTFDAAGRGAWESAACPTAAQLPEGAGWWHGPPRRGGRLLTLALLLLAVGAGAYPVARRLTRRIERLQKAVESLGSGRALGARRGPGARRGGGARRELQRRRGAHRDRWSARTSRCSPTPRTSCARRSRASAWPWS